MSMMVVVTLMIMTASPSPGTSALLIDKLTAFRRSDYRWNSLHFVVNGMSCGEYFAARSGANHIKS